MAPRGNAHIRVAAGEAGGRRLLAPRHIRPTQGLVKEAVFDMVGPAVADAVVIDLFSGSGSLGIEALSRGAASATFVERDDASVSILRRNLASLGYGSRSRVVRAEAVRWLRAHQSEVGEATLVLMDPPYRDAALEAALLALDTACSPGCIVVAEHENGARIPGLSRLEPVRERRYGSSAVTILRAAEA